MTVDPNKKSERVFQCRDVLWDTFEQMARDLECSVDYLINEAMKQYARQRSQGVRPAPSSRVDLGSAPAMEGMLNVRGSMGFPAPPTRRPSPVPPPPTGSRAPVGALAPPPLPSLGSPGLPSPSRGLPPPLATNRSVSSLPLPAASRGASLPPLSTLSGRPTAAPPPIPMEGRGSASLAPTGVASGRTLTAVYLGEYLPVTKDRFVIGRGRQSSDLTIKDPNVSRQHAMVEFNNGNYYMVDLGSTNGVEFNGQRVSKRVIAEGDIYRICDHEVRFTFR